MKDGHDEDLLRALAGFPEDLLRFLASDEEIAESGRDGFLARDDVPRTATRETVKSAATYILEKCYAGLEARARPRSSPVNFDWLDAPLSENEVEKRVADALSELRLFGEVEPKRADFACDGCKYERRCPLAYDVYNTNGDCLMEK